MRTLIGSALLLAFLTPAFAGSLADLSDKNGFLDLTCGTPIDAHAFKLKEARDGDYKTYARASDSLRDGSAELSSIGYRFHEGKFVGATIRGVGPSNCTALRDTLVSAYGPPYRKGEGLERYDWNEKRTMVSFDYNATIFVCKAWIDCIHPPEAQAPTSGL